MFETAAWPCIVFLGLGTRLTHLFWLGLLASMRRLRGEEVAVLEDMLARFEPCKRSDVQLFERAGVVHTGSIAR